MVFILQLRVKERCSEISHDDKSWRFVFPSAMYSTMHQSRCQESSVTVCEPNRRASFSLKKVFVVQQYSVAFYICPHVYLENNLIKMHTVQIMLNVKEQDMLTYNYTYLLSIHTLSFKLH